MLDRKKRVLIIDDEAGLTLLIKLCLEDTGNYIVQAATRGETGLLAARAFEPDVILLDAIMPDMSGHDVALQIRADPAIGRTPIVFLTATVSDNDDRTAAGSLFDFPVIAKPATAEARRKSRRDRGKVGEKLWRWESMGGGMFMSAQWSILI